MVPAGGPCRPDWNLMDGHYGIQYLFKANAVNEEEEEEEEGLFKADAVN